MAIFGKKPEPPERPSPEQESGPPPGGRSQPEPPPASATTKAASFLGASCRLDGEFRGKGSLECRGRFQGTVEIDGDVIIGREGKVEARLSARRIVIGGRLKGDAIGTEKVEVGATGHVEGDVRAPAVMFQEGAFFEGNVEMHRSRSGATDGTAAAPDGPGGGSGGDKGSTSEGRSGESSGSESGDGESSGSESGDGESSGSKGGSGESSGSKGGSGESSGSGSEGRTTGN